MIRTVIVAYLLLNVIDTKKRSDFVYYTTDTSNPNYYCDEEEYYCGIFGNIKNTVCLREKCGPTATCGDYFKMLPLNDRERNAIVHLHNEIRHDVAMTGVSKAQMELDLKYFQGNLTEYTETEVAGMRYYFPRIKEFSSRLVLSRMNTMSYDKELEFVAQCWANNCMSNGRLIDIYDTCRKTSRFKKPGQAVFVYTVVSNQIKTIHFDDMKYLDRAIFSWYNEVLQFTEAEQRQMFNLYTYRLNGKSMINFLQLTYPKARFVGCGRNQFGFGNTLSFLLVCNYDKTPKIGKPVYQFSDMCASKCTKKYFHLNANKMLSRKYCKFDGRLGDRTLDFLNCMYKFHAVAARRLYNYEEYQDKNPFNPCLCGRKRGLDRDMFNPPFEISSMADQKQKVALGAIVFLFYLHSYL